MAAAKNDFDEAGLLAEARAIAGFHDFGDDGFLTPLRVLLASLADEASLNDSGRATMRGRVLESLVARLRAEDWFVRHPEIADEHIEAPLVVVGLARSGTTMLQRILASDPRHYAALWWEVRYPTPFPGTNFSEPDLRIPIAEREVRMILEASPEQAAIHPWDALAPDEEIMLLEHSFLSHVPEAFCNLPTYRSWLDDQDFAPAYEYLAKMLRFLQWQKKRRGEVRGRWVLKAPGHLGYLDVLFEVFPGAHVIQCHRDPLQTIPSGASMNVSLWALNTDEVDAKEVGHQWKERMAWALGRCVWVRDRMPAERFTDIWFRDAAADPIREVRRVYANAGIAFVSEARNAMEKWLVDNARDKRPAHEYSLAKFGFTEAEIRADFAAYRARFIEPRQGVKAREKMPKTPSRILD